MAAETPMVVRITLGGLCAVIAVVMVTIGVMRPASLWSAAKIQNAVRVIGDTGLSIVFIVLGLTSLAGALVIALKR